MNRFTYHNPTKIFFGQDAIDRLGDQLKPYNNILLAYGGGSIKRNGIYDRVMDILAEHDKQVVELSGIMPNPRTEKVYEGIKLCRAHEIDLILAVGGGSTIDCCKAIAGGVKTDRDFWETFYVNGERCYDALPLASILTLSGTGSEMNMGSVITNWDAKLKLSYECPAFFPKFSILDPTYTYSLPKDQMVYGAVDILSHLFELYFSPPDASCLSDDIAEAIMKNVIQNLNTALENPFDYTARANLMWSSTMALNGIPGLSKKLDWQTHQIEHALSAFHDIPHGAGLAVVHPNFMEHVYKKAPGKFARYAVNIWGVDPDGKDEEEVALAGILRTKAYFKSIGAPTTLGEVGIKAEEIDEIASTVNLLNLGYVRIDLQDVKQILKNCL